MELFPGQNGITISFDNEKTREYYSGTDLCDCPGCLNFYAQARDRFPGLTEWLEQFGVPIDRPDEIMYLDIAENVNYLCVSYTVCGRIEGAQSAEIPLTGGEFPSVTVCSPDAPTGDIPNSHKGEYFVIDVTEFSLPWVLDDPVSC